MGKKSSQNKQSIPKREPRIDTYSERTAKLLLSKIEKHIAPKSSWSHWLPYGNYKAQHDRHRKIIQGMIQLQGEYFSPNNVHDKDQILGEWCSLSDVIKSRLPTWGFKKSLLANLGELSAQFERKLNPRHTKVAEWKYVCPLTESQLRPHKNKYARALKDMRERVESLIRSNQWLSSFYANVLAFGFPDDDLSIPKLRIWQLEYTKAICHKLGDAARLNIPASLISDLLRALADNACHLTVEPFIASNSDLGKVRSLTEIYLQIDVPFRPCDSAEFLIIPPLKGALTQSHVKVKNLPSGLGLCISNTTTSSFPPPIVHLLDEIPETLNYPWLIELHKISIGDRVRAGHIDANVLKQILCLTKVDDRTNTLFPSRHRDPESAVKAVGTLQQFLQGKIAIVEDPRQPIEVRFSHEPCGTQVVTQGISVQDGDTLSPIIPPLSYVSAGPPRTELSTFLEAIVRNKRECRLLDILSDPSVCLALSKPSAEVSLPKNLENDIRNDVTRLVNSLSKRVGSATANRDELGHFIQLINDSLPVLRLKVSPVGKKQAALTVYDFDPEFGKGHDLRYTRSAELFGRSLQSEKWVESLGPTPKLWPHFDDLTEQVKKTGFQASETRSRLGSRLLTLISTKGLPLQDESVREICELIRYKVWPEPGQPFDAKLMTEVESVFSDKIPLGLCLSIREVSLMDAAGSLIISLESGLPIKPKVIVSRGPKPQLLEMLEGDAKFTQSPLADEIAVLSRDYDPREFTWRKRLGELTVKAINYFLAHFGDQLAFLNHKLCEVVRRQLPELGGMFIFPPLLGEPTSRQSLQAFRIEGKAASKFLKSWLDTPPSEKVFSIKPKGEIERVLSYAGVMMTESTSDTSKAEIFGNFAFIASDGIDRWRADLSQSAYDLLSDFPQDEKQASIGRMLLQDLEKNSLGCHLKQPEAEIASNRHLFHFLSQIDWISDTQNHLLPSDRSQEFIALRKQMITRIAAEPSIACTPGPADSDINSLTTVSSKFLVPGPPGKICEVLRRQCSLAGRSLSDGALIGVGYDGPLPQHWEIVQAIYIESRLNNGFHHIGLDALLEARSNYLKSGNALAILSVIQCAEMSCKELGEKDERPTYRRAIDAAERVLETECGLRRISLRRWHAVPVGEKYNNYRIQYVNIPGRGRELVVRILSPAYENIKDGVCSNLGLVQLTS